MRQSSALSHLMIVIWSSVLFCGLYSRCHWWCVPCLVHRLGAVLVKFWRRNVLVGRFSSRKKTPLHFRALIVRALMLRHG